MADQWKTENCLYMHMHALVEILRLLMMLEKSPRMTTVTRAQTDNLEKLQPGTGHTKPGKWKTRESRGFSNKQRSFDNEPEVSKRRKEVGHE